MIGDQFNLLYLSVSKMNKEKLLLCFSGISSVHYMASWE